jgi:Mg/Co/Ni transporter MgtE
MSIEKIILEDFFDNHIDEALKSLSSCSDLELVSLIKNLPDDNVYQLFSRIESYKAVNIISLIEHKTAAEILDNIPTQAAMIILRQLDQVKRNQILSVMPERIAIQLRQLLQYDDLSVGALMNVNVFTFHNDLSVKEALDEVKQSDVSIPAQIFVVNRDKILQGVVELDQLIRANSKDDLNKITKTNTYRVLPEINIKSILHHEAWQIYYSLPVVDGDDFFLGTISLETIRGFVENKTANDFSKAGSALGELYRIGFAGLIRSAAGLTSKLEK